MREGAGNIAVETALQRHCLHQKDTGGAASMYTGIDGLAAIVKYRLNLNPYNGSIYVFRDGTGSMPKYIE